MVPELLPRLNLVGLSTRERATANRIFYAKSKFVFAQNSKFGTFSRNLASRRCSLASGQEQFHTNHQKWKYFEAKLKCNTRLNSGVHP